MKKFLMATSQLPEDMLELHTYEPVDNPALTFAATHFPAIPLVAANIEPGDEIEVITVTYDIPECKRNLRLLERELADLCAARGAAFAIKSIDVPFDDSISAILNVYQRLIGVFSAGDELFADITFGSKPMPIVIVMALQYACRVLDGVSVECVTYGQISHHEATKDARIYDITALVQLDEIVQLLAAGGAADAAGVIGNLIGD